VPYQEVDVSVNPRAAEEIMRRTGQMGVPVITDAQEAIVGFDLVAIWGLWFCVEISQAGPCCPVRSKQERYAPTARKRRRRST